MLAVAAAEPPRTSVAVLSRPELHVCAPIDANGNLTSDGTRAFEWDARNQLVAISVGLQRSEFVYDGEQRRSRVIEKYDAVIQSDTKYVWCDSSICGQRGSDGVAVASRSFSRGEQVATAAHFFALDHLDSITEVADTSAITLARYAFDPWGRRTLISGSDVTNIGFTGHRQHGGLDVFLAQYRAYDANLARWLSQDPIGLSDGPNLYS